MSIPLEYKCLFIECVAEMIDEIPGAVIARPENGTDFPPSVFQNDSVVIEEIPTDQTLSLIYPEERRTTFISLLVDENVTAITVEYKIPDSNYTVSRLYSGLFINAIKCHRIP